MAASARRVLLLALVSRLAVLSGMVISDLAFRDLDSSAHLQSRPCDGFNNAEADSKAAGALATALNHLGPWDTVHFVRIAKCGYETDMSNAFFPLLPLAMWSLAALPGVSRLSNVLQPEAVFTLAGLAISLIAFCFAALALHRLSLRVLRSTSLADLSLLLFCCNPASVFYSAAYSESLYAALTFSGLLLLPDTPWLAVALLAAAGAARSNGILACWFLIHRLLAACKQQGRLPWATAAGTVAGCSVILGPYVAHQAQAFLTFCKADEAPEWCSRAVPSVYSYIQRRYWGVGLLHFYHDPRRWPMILTAAPVAYLSIKGCWTYFSADWLRALMLGLFKHGEPLPAALRWLLTLLPNPAAPAAAGASRGRPAEHRRSARLAAVAAAGKQTAGKPRAAGLDAGFLATAAAPYVYHWALMTVVALLVMNVNVATRFLSACPPFYWFTAHYLSESSSTAGGGSTRWHTYWVWGWCLSYTVLGCLLFPNFYPWV